MKVIADFDTDQVALPGVLPDRRPTAQPTDSHPVGSRARCGGIRLRVRVPPPTRLLGYDSRR